MNIGKGATQSKKIEVYKFPVYVTLADINEGECRLANRCMLKVAVERFLRKESGASDHHVRVDAGHITFTKDGYRWRADTPKLAKAMLLRFDAEAKLRRIAAKEGRKFVSKVEPFSVSVHAIRGSKIAPATTERKRQINAARNKRKAEGRPDRRYTLHQRVVGFA